MSSLKYGVYPGLGEWALETRGYSQAVRVADRIEISGQGTLPVFRSCVLASPNILLATRWLGPQCFDAWL